MPLPGHPAGCPHPFPVVIDLKIRMPGGATIQVPAPVLPSPGEQSAKLLGTLSAALAPLMPLFDIVDALTGAVKVFSAVKTLNPPAIGNALVDFVITVDRLKLLLPQVSAVLLVKDLLIALRVYVEDLVVQLEALVVVEARIAAVEAQAQTFVGLEAHVTCARATLTATFASVKQGGAPVARILRVVNLVAALGGLPAVPPLEFGVDASASLPPLRALAEVLQTLENALPG